MNDTERQQVAEALRAALVKVAGPASHLPEHAADALAPVIDCIANQRAAEALEDHDCGHHSWAGLMALLDEHWPDDIFPTREDDITRDAGARIVSLMRWVNRLRADALTDQATP